MSVISLSNIIHILIELSYPPDNSLFPFKLQRETTLRVVSQKVKIMKQTLQMFLQIGWNQKMRVKGVYKQVVNRLVIGIQDQMEERYVNFSRMFNTENLSVLHLMC